MKSMEGRSLEETPTWAVATIITLLVAVGVCIHGGLKKFGKWLDRTKRKHLLAALDKVKEELMVFGLLSLLMGHWIAFISKICVKSSALSSRFYPCVPRIDVEHETVVLRSNHFNSSIHRLLLDDAHGHFCPKDHQPFASHQSLEQLHRFLFVLGVTHVSYSFLAIALAMIKIYSWRSWENHAKTLAFRGLLSAGTLTAKSLSVLSFVSAASFGAQLTKLTTWLYDLVLLLLINYLSHMISIIICSEVWRKNFEILLELVGTKLHHIVVKLAVEIMDSSRWTGEHQFNLRDELFWFGSPRLLLRLIQFVSFQNAFEMATYIWSLWEIREPTCFSGDRNLLIIRLTFGVISQFWCSFITFPLYVIVTQMGSKFKKTIVTENVRRSLHGWTRKVKAKQDGPAFSLVTVPSTASLDSMVDEEQQQRQHDEISPCDEKLQDSFSKPKFSRAKAKQKNLSRFGLIRYQFHANMVLEATMICIDNSEWMRNGDYSPNRFQAQADAVNLICGAKTQSNPENTVGVLTMAGKGVCVLVTPTSDLGKILACMHGLEIGGEMNLAAGIQVAQLALKHRQNKKQQQRIIVFAGSPVKYDKKVLELIGRKLKKNSVALDIVNFGEEDAEKTEKLEALLAAVNNNDSSHIVNVPPGASALSDVLISTPIFTGDGEGGTGFAAAAAAAAAGGGGYDFGVDPNLDPELALALRVSMEEERARQEAAAKKAAEEAGKQDKGEQQSTSQDAIMTENVNAGISEPEKKTRDLTVGELCEMLVEKLRKISYCESLSCRDGWIIENRERKDDENALLQQALAMSMDDASSSVAVRDTDMSDASADDHDLQLALQLSVQESAGDQSEQTDMNKLLADQSFVSSILASLPGVDPNDPSVKDLLASMQSQSEIEEKKQAAADVLFNYSSFALACIGNQVRPCDLRLHLMKEISGLPTSLKRESSYVATSPDVMGESSSSGTSKLDKTDSFRAI
ncbi:hypothetical protein RD792_001164 [Penstemon davidsonii]|uniref:26S proteasome regulatory subunit RPN10 n=1 Tax=Penstemon davidsonii TaxID=160366 RepID=A0ABR0DMP8_9LAMI|nr:hypothetical protein RD792_001164 [Penstemon davidsonii]